MIFNLHFHGISFLLSPQQIILTSVPYPCSPFKPQLSLLSGIFTLVYHIQTSYSFLVLSVILQDFASVPFSHAFLLRLLFDCTFCSNLLLSCLLRHHLLIEFASHQHLPLFCSAWAHNFQVCTMIHALINTLLCSYFLAICIVVSHLYYFQV